MEENEANKQLCDREEEEVKAKEAGSGWGGWGVSMFSDIKKAAAAAAEEISRTVRMLNFPLFLLCYMI